MEPLPDRLRMYTMIRYPLGGIDYGRVLQSVWNWVTAQRSILFKLRRSPFRGAAHAWQAADAPV